MVYCLSATALRETASPLTGACNTESNIEIIPSLFGKLDNVITSFLSTTLPSTIPALITKFSCFFANLATIFAAVVSSAPATNALGPSKY